MEIAAIRESLHQYINNSDEKLLKLILALAEAYNEVEDYEFTTKELNSFNERRSKRLSGESKVYNWAEAREVITGGNAV